MRQGTVHRGRAVQPSQPPPPLPDGIDCEAVVQDPTPDKLLAVLQGVWGHEGFRGLQLEAVQAVLRGESTLAIMPTGMWVLACFLEVFFVSTLVDLPLLNTYGCMSATQTMDQCRSHL